MRSAMGILEKWSSQTKGLQKRSGRTAEEQEPPHTTRDEGYRVYECTRVPALLGIEGKGTCAGGGVTGGDGQHCGNSSCALARDAWLSVTRSVASFHDQAENENRRVFLNLAAYSRSFRGRKGRRVCFLDFRQKTRAIPWRGCERAA